MKLYQLVPTVLALAVLGLSSCANRNEVYSKVDSYVAKRDFQSALAELKENKSKIYYSDLDGVVALLDVGMLHHLRAESKEAIAKLTEAEQLIEENFTQSITNAAASFLLNDLAMEYTGEAYEDLYLNVFKAIDFIKQGSFDGGFVEIRRLGNKLNLLEDRYKKLAQELNSSDDAKTKVAAGDSEFYDSALARYLSFLLYRADGRLDSAAIDLKKIDEAFAKQPNIFKFAKPNLKGLLDNTSQARLSVVSFTGRIPVKKANTIRISTGIDSISFDVQREGSDGKLFNILSDRLSIKGIESGFYFKCETPYLEALPSNIFRVAVLVDGAEVGQLSLLEDLSAVAMETFKVKEPLTFVKTLVRTTVKGILAQEARKAANDAAASQGDAGILLALFAGVAADVAIEASETADLRSSRFFPGKAHVGDFIVSPGEHSVALSYFGKNGKLLYTDDLGTRNFNAKGLNLVTSTNRD